MFILALRDAFFQVTYKWLYLCTGTNGSNEFIITPHSDLILYTISISSDSNTRKLTGYDFKNWARSQRLQHLTYKEMLHKMSVCSVPINMQSVEEPASVICTNWRVNADFVRQNSLPSFLSWIQQTLNKVALFSKPRHETSGTYKERGYKQDKSTTWYTQSNKNPLAWYFVRPAQAVTYGTVPIIIRVVLLSPYLRIRGISLSSIRYNESHSIY